MGELREAWDGGFRNPADPPEYEVESVALAMGATLPPAGTGKGIIARMFISAKVESILAMHARRQASGIPPEYPTEELLVRGALESAIRDMIFLLPR